MPRLATVSQTARRADRDPSSSDRGLGHDDNPLPSMPRMTYLMSLSAGSPRNHVLVSYRCAPNGVAKKDRVSP